MDLGIIGKMLHIDCKGTFAASYIINPLALSQNFTDRRATD